MTNWPPDLRRKGAESFVKSSKDLLDRIRWNHTALKAGGWDERSPCRIVIEERSAKMQLGMIGLGRMGEPVW